MAKEMKKLKDVLIGDVFAQPKKIIAKTEHDDRWVLHFEDGTSSSISKTGDPSIEVGT